MLQPLLIILFISSLYSQCDGFSQSECDNNGLCDWVEELQTINCSSLSNSSSCASYSDYGCSWEFSWGGWQNYGSTCVGGSFQIHNGYCEEIQMPQCSEMAESQCDSSNNCNWVDDVEYGWCGSHNTSASCPDYPTCSWGCDGCWYLGECCGSYICTGGYYQIDNSVCEEIDYQLGDITGDYIININDIVALVNIILNNSPFNSVADMNSDNLINISDIVSLVDLILNS